LLFRRVRRDMPHYKVGAAKRICLEEYYVK
jgi:hypothetical protein